MGFRFRRSIRLFPGVRLNVSKSGASVSVGGKGLTVNVGKTGVTRTVSLPGTGLSHRERIDSGGGRSSPPEGQRRPSGVLQGWAKALSIIIGLALVGVVLLALLPSH